MQTPAFTFHVGVALLVVAEPQRHPLLQRQTVRGVQQVVQELVVDLVEGHPDGIAHALGQVVSSAVRKAVGLQTDAVAVCRWLKELQRSGGSERPSGTKGTFECAATHESFRTDLQAG